MSDMSIDDFEYDSSKRWWETKPDRVRCLLALDPTASIEEGGRVIRTRAETPLTLRTKDGDAITSVEKRTLVGVRRAKNRPEWPSLDDPLVSFDCLSFKRAFYEFETPISALNDFTLIIRMMPGPKISSDYYPVVLGSSERNLYLGAFRRTTGPRQYLFSEDIWDGGYGANFYNLGNGAKYPLLKDHDIDFAVYTYDSTTATYKVYSGTRAMRAEEVQVVTDRNPTASVAYDYKNIISLGRDHPEDNLYNRFTGSVLAIGLFDFALTKEECFKMLAQIDGEFIKGTVEVTTTSPSETLLAKRERKTFLKEDIERARVRYNTFPALREGTHPYKLNYIKASTKTFRVDITGEPYTIKDIVTKEEEPTISKLFLYEKYSGKLIASAWSNEQGEFEFRGLNPDIEYIVHSYDKDLQYKSIIKDYN